jgi:hypothetical protein
MSGSKRLFEEAMDKIPSRPISIESTTWKRPGHNTAGPCTEAICDLFDATCIADMIENSDSTEEIPSYRTIFYLGFRDEPDAGIVGGALTDIFNSENEVESFCSRNWEKFHLLADAYDDNPNFNLYDVIVTWRSNDCSSI